MQTKSLFPLTILVLLAMSFAATAHAQVEPPAVYDLDDKSTVNILENGDTSVTEVISMSASAFAAFKQEYPTLSMLVRLFKPRNIPIQIENLKITVDEANNKIIATYVIKGAAVNKGNRWEVQVAAEGEKITLSAQIERSVIFTSTGYITSEIREIITTTINFPPEAKNIRFHEDENKVTYELPQPAPPTGIGGNIIFLASGLIVIAVAVINLALARRRMPPPPPPPPPPPNSPSFGAEQNSRLLKPATRIKNVNL